MKRPLDPKASRALWLRQFDMAGQEPIAWLGEALQLKRAADVVNLESQKDFAAIMSGKLKVGDKVEPLVGSVYMLLAGLALENLLKGICVGRKPAIVEKGKLKKWAGASHDLHDLANAANIELTQAESYLLEGLTQFILWAGRYPIPKAFEDIVPRKMPSGGFAPISLSCNDPTLVNKLFNRFARVLEEESSAKRTCRK